MMDTHLRADGVKNCVNIFESIGEKTDKTNKDGISESDMISRVATIIDKEKQLCEKGLMPSSGPAINSTDVVNKLSTPIPPNSSLFQFTDGGSYFSRAFFE